MDVLTDTQAIELDWLKGNKFHEGIGQALHYGDVTGQQPVLVSGMAAGNPANGGNRGGNGGRFRSAIWMVMDFAVRECHIPDYRHRLV